MDELEGKKNKDYSTTSTSSSPTDLGPGGSPGDGVCPSISSLQAVFRAVYDSWATPATQRVPDGQDDLFDTEKFFQLMTRFPPFRPHPLKDLIAPGATPSELIVDLVMSLETCLLPACTQREKRIPYHLLIGSSTWNTYKAVCLQDHEKVSQLGLPLHSLRYLTRLVLAWSYVLCCRWVEILKSSGEDAAIICSDMGATNDIWEMIRGERWQAIVSHNDQVYYSPFMLRSSQCLDAEIDYSLNIDHSSFNAFKLTTEFCKSRSLLHECVLALVIALSLISPDRAGPELLEWTSNVEPAIGRNVDTDQFERLWDVLDQSMTMGCVLGAADSLICSVFFDPTIPCNAVGAQWMAVRRALELDHHRYDHLITAIKNRRPDLTALWLGVISTGQVERIIDFAMKPLPSVNLAVGTWTGVVQSFLQVQYDTSVGPNQTISRASEFSTAYYVQPERNLPLCRAPPFGRTLTANTNLEVREHLKHHHRPQQAKYFWVLKDGQVAEAHEGISVRCPIVSLWQPEENSIPAPSDTQDWCDAMEISSIATSYIFSWHCQHEGGLWLDEGHGPEAARKIQTHPWIDTPLFDESESEEDEKSKKSSPDCEKIVSWRDGVSQARRTRCQAESL